MKLNAVINWWKTRLIRAKRKAAAATGARFYGDGGTIHRTGHLDVETKDGKVVAVWFRCCRLPFQQAEVTQERSDQLGSFVLNYSITGVEIKDIE